MFSLIVVDEQNSMKLLLVSPRMRGCQLVFLSCVCTDLFTLLGRRMKEKNTCLHQAF